jgi:cytidylate kinase
MGSATGVIMDGRDIGTIVFPEADYKFFLIASPKIRAKRRYEEQQKAGITETLKEVLANITARDHQDSTRTVTPLKKAKDAIEIDVSYMSIDDVFNVLIESIVKS